LAHNGFNPRAREGRDKLRFTAHLEAESFNPRAREGRDRTKTQLMPRGFSVSIHAPVKDATPPMRAAALPALFQSTRP